MFYRKSQNKPARFTGCIAGGLLIAAGIAVTGCGGSDGDDSATDKSMSIQMNLPDSMTGGKVAQVSVQSFAAAAAASSSNDVPCAWIGPEDDSDPFRNGYEMTKFMVSAVATWTCITDNLIDLSDTVDNDGLIHETENDLDADDYDEDDPTHYSVTIDSETQTTIRLYYARSRAIPPMEGEDSAFYFSWNENGEARYDGRLIVDVTRLNKSDRKADDPVMMRMDVSRTDVEQSTDMILRFDEGNEWAEGFRIVVTKDLTAQANEQVFIARGLMDMKRQFFIDTGISELPMLQMYTVSDRFGNGAAVADFIDIALPLEIIPATETEPGNHLGNYLSTKNDIYVFDEDGDWEWVNKSFSSAEYRGGRTTPATGGTIDPLNPSLEGIAMYFNLNTTEQTYFEGDACNNEGDDCTELLNAIYDDGFAEQEQNQGEDPNDWRSMAIAEPDYLPSVYPNSENWNGAFDMVFIP
jgi:hypothetical protein